LRKALILVLSLAGCGRESEQPPVRPPVQTAALTGLYQGRGGAARNQLCLVERGGEGRFGLVAWRGGDPGCSGAGTAVREGGRLRLDMAGEEACRLEARIDGRAVAFPAAAPPGCAYYCAPGASFAGLAFEKVGGSEVDALRARDLVGDALCG